MTRRAGGRWAHLPLVVSEKWVRRLGKAERHRKGSFPGEGLPMTAARPLPEAKNRVTVVVVVVMVVVVAAAVGAVVVVWAWPP